MATVLLGVHLVLCEERPVEYRLVLMTTAIGTIVETAQMALQTYQFPSGVLWAGVPPLWLLAMWAQMATTFRFSLRSVMMQPWRAALFGAFGGPLAFLAGERLGAVILARPVWPGLVRLSVTWTIVLLIMSKSLIEAGEVSRVEPGPVSERGGLEVSTVRMLVGTTPIRTLMYRAPNGAIEEFLFNRR